MKKIILLMFLGALSFSCSNDDGGKKDKPAPKPDYEPKILVPFQERGLWGFRDPQANVVVVVPQYEEVKDFDSHKIARVKKTKLWGLINMLGKTVIDPTYNNIEDFSGEGYATVIKLEKSGIINTKGEEKVEPIFDKVFGYYDKQYVKVQSENKFGIIDKDWKLVVKPKYDLIEESKDEKEATYKIVLDGKWGLLNKNWQEVISPRFDYDFKIFEFDKSGVAKLKVGEKWGFIDKNYKVVVEPIYDEIKDFDEQNFARIKVGDKWGILGRDYKVLLEPIYDDITVFNEEGFARVRKDKKWGVINKEWKVVLPTEYDNIGELLSYKMTKLFKEGRIGLADLSWKVVLPVKYVDINITEDQGTVRIYDNIEGFGKLEGLFDLTSHVVLEPIYRKIENYDRNNLVIVQHPGGMYNLLDKKFKEKFAEPYLTITLLSIEEGGHYKLGRGMYVGLADVTARILIEADKYSDIAQFEKDNKAIVMTPTLSYGLINREWKEVLATDYKNISAPDSKMNRILKVDTTWFNIYTQNGKKLESNYNHIIPDYTNGVILLRNGEEKGALHGFATDNLSYYEDAKYKEMFNFSGTEVSAFSYDGLFGLMNKQGVKVIGATYDRIIRHKDDDHTTLIKGGLYGFANSQGLIKVDARYEMPDYNQVVDGLAKVRYQDHITVVNYATGAELFKPGSIEDADNLFNGYASYLISGKWGIVNKSGTEIAKAKYDKVERFNREDNTVRMTLGSYKGVMNAKGVIIVEANRYDYIGLFKDGRAQATRAGVTVILNSEGKEI
ncbi:WG repeat-containing protein [Myroides marinus]|uniref:WG repeat-containing protein n=1 Tax=Myroides marinus TaxID=703342 RepID=UPI002574B958|nr:WG repeat-containing protein [Myroides marinus]MDM1347021.1 WG repeat-containing protein [Myroides marinus]MDM1351568.1 WG repeat-containing protein [Myroides marinus]MDM1358790.1 WG repeat-containing protein [Myroides marinus]MDM1362684.1 WG repeat-containing protein [Myroides marinus]MDM1365885.1 WG repeat-containing protein [Myroides marinus]